METSPFIDAEFNLFIDNILRYKQCVLQQCDEQQAETFRKSIDTIMGKNLSKVEKGNAATADQACYAMQCALAYTLRNRFCVSRTSEVIENVYGYMKRDHDRIAIALNKPLLETKVKLAMKLIQMPDGLYVRVLNAAKSCYNDGKEYIDWNSLNGYEMIPDDIKEEMAKISVEDYVTCFTV